MTKIHTKTALLFAVLGASFALSAGTVSAWTLPDIDLTPKIKLPALDIKLKNTEEFCANFTATAEKIAEKITKQQSKVNTYIENREDALDEKRDARDSKLSDARSAADTRRAEWYDRLATRANTDAEEDALLVFKQTMENAVDTRQAAVDAAIKAFRDGVDTAIETRESSMKDASTKFKTAVDAAAAQVKTDCDNGKTTTDIKKTFRSSLKAARDQLKTDRQNAEKIRTQIEALAKTRKTAVDKALGEFKTTATKAVETLKTAFSGN